MTSKHFVRGMATVNFRADDVAAARDWYAKLLGAPPISSATEYDPITKREAGFVTASVVDPFGNILGIMYNPHYLEMLESHTA